MKLAVRKDEGSVPGGGYHYMLMPKKFEDERETQIWQMMGHIIIEVPDEHGERLLTQAGAALNHQMEVAVLTEKAIKDKA